MKHLVVGFILLIIMVSAGLFADDILEAQYNEPGQINLTGIVGFHPYGLSLGVGAEFIIDEINIIPEFPMEWGVSARGLGSFYMFDGYKGMDYGVAPLATLHKGFNFGKNLEFDFTLGLGLGIYGYSYSYSYSVFGTDYKTDYSDMFNIGFASFDSLSWKMKENLWITLEYGYVGWKGIYGIGVRMVM